MIYQKIIFSLFLYTLIIPISKGNEILNQPLELLNELVRINSHSKNLDGLQKIRNILLPEFQKLGFQSKSYSLENGHQLLVFDFPENLPKLLLIGHIDTVFPDSNFSVESKEESHRIYGPGIIDMKGGLVVMIKALEKLSLNERKKIRIIINDDEELASIYSKEKILDIVQKIPFGLVFEPGLPDGSLVTSSSGGRWIKIQVKGKAAHAGLEHAKGINACTELAHKITQLHQLTDYSKKITLNIGTVEGGTQPNVVCENASVVIDIRYVQPKDLNQLLSRIKKIVKKNNLHHLLNSSIEMIADVPSMPSASTNKLFSLAKEVGDLFQIKIQGKHVGYATDGNHLVKSGMNLLVGLGPYGGGMHTGQEFIEKNSLKERIFLSYHLIQKILKNPDEHVSNGLFENQTVFDKKYSPLKNLSLFRLIHLNEWMLPSLGNQNRFIPRPSGANFVPSFGISQIHVDYEVIENYRIFYLQKGFIKLSSSSGGSSTQRLLDPRFGIKRSQLFSFPGFFQEYDFFIQPGLAQTLLLQPERTFDLGVRLSHRYHFLDSKWSIGGNIEGISSFFKSFSHSPNFLGTLTLLGNYRISKWFSTQHSLFAFYKHIQKNSLFKFSWAITEMPYFQNGIIIQFFEEMNLGFMFNQYAFKLPRPQNMWASFLISIYLK